MRSVGGERGQMWSIGWTGMAQSGVAGLSRKKVGEGRGRIGGCNVYATAEAFDEFPTAN